MDKKNTHNDKVKHTNDVNDGTEEAFQNEPAVNSFFCVGIGASAGGLEALREFFNNMPDESGMAFVVVQHLSPDYKSLMDELLSRHTKMRIHVAEDQMPVQPNRIYLIPPKKEMTIFHDRLYLSEQNPSNGLNLPINVFFRSLAEDKGKNAIGIILSGTGSDGTLGIRAIKEAHGMVMVQDDRSAKFDGMPRSSIATGLVDYVLHVDKMPEELIKYTKHPYIKKDLKIERLVNKDDDILSKIVHIIKRKIGIDFIHYKPNTILRRLEKRISINQINKIENYIAFLEQSPQEAQILYKELLIGVTQFFRDEKAWEEFEEDVIPNLFKDKPPGSIIRLWSVGCSTGEEPYSLAIILREYIQKHNLDLDVKIFATDIDKDAIAFAGAGVYPESIASDINPERLEKFFVTKGDGYHITEEIRRMVIFASHNTITDPPFSKLDLISCRNMLIYLKPHMQRKILSMFYFALKKGGFMFLGSSESLGNISEGFIQISSRWKIFKYREGFKPPISTDFLSPPVQQPSKKQSKNDLGYSGNEKDDNYFILYNEIIKRFLPPSVLVNEYFEVVNILKDINRYICIPTGKISLNLLRMVKPEIATVLASLLNKALRDKETVTFRNIKMNFEDSTQYITLAAKILEDNLQGRKYILVSFEDEQKEGAPSHVSIDPSKIMDNNQQMMELEKELQYTKENLQATIEELETSNEELQSTNEELIASNEELQSTNEELQSVNEELYTVNSEYQSKIEELTVLNSDMDNLLKNTNIGTLFLDRNLRIRKFTPKIRKIVKLLDMDIGRPIEHLSLNTTHPGLVDDIRGVMNTLKNVEKEIQDKEGFWYRLSIIPYRTPENAVEGVTLTLVDIHGLKQTENDLKREQDLLRMVQENSPVANMTLNAQGEFTYLNRKAQKLLRIREDQYTSHKYNILPFEVQDIYHKKVSDEKLPFSLIVKTKKPVLNIKQRLVWEDGTEIVIQSNGSPVFDVDCNVIGAVFSFYEITQEVEKEMEVKARNQMLISVLDNSPLAKVLVDIDGNIEYMNKEFKNIFVEKLPKSKDPSIYNLGWQMYDTDDKKLTKSKNPFAIIFKEDNHFQNYEIVFKKANNKVINASLYGTTVLMKNNNQKSAVFSFIV